MTTYLAFLRAINLGANRKFPKADIERAVEGVGFKEVETHINTGNVRFSTAMRSRARIEEALERAFLADRGFEVPTIVFTLPEFAEIARVGAELREQRPKVSRHYVELLKDEPPKAQASALEATSTATGEVFVRGRAIHVLLTPKYEGNTIVNAAASAVGVSTNRNFNVIDAIARKWC